MASMPANSIGVWAPPAATVRPATADPGAGSYLVAVLVPIVGVILGIIALAKNKVGPGLALVLTAWVAMAVWATLIMAVSFGSVVSTFNDSSDTSSLVQNTSSSSSSSADDTDGDGVEDSIDSDPYDETVQ
jgi:hypothetical protein